MNYNRDGSPIFKIIRKTGNGKESEKIVYLDSNPESLQDSIKEIKLKTGERIQQTIDIDKERTILLVTGPSGSGKSYYSKHFIMEYKKIYPKRSIYLFSSLTSDPTIDSIKNLKRIKLDSNFMQATFEISDFKNTLIIFDDCDCITNKNTRDKINSLQSLILETGRHTNTSVIITSHLATRGAESKRILNECHTITVFPQSAGGKSLNYLLNQYLGLSNSQILKIKKLPTRWITVVKSCPTTVFYEKGAYMLNSYDLEN
jgi:hypothetical protein